MNKFSKCMLMIFSLIVCIISICLILVFNYIVPVEDVAKILEVIINASSNYTFVITTILSVITLSALVTMFIPADSEESKKGIKIKYDKGTLYLSKESFENLVLSCAKKIEGISNLKAKVMFSKDGVLVNVYAYVYSDVIVSSLTEKLQKEISNTIERCTTAKVKSVDVKVKGIITKNSQK